MNKHKQGSVEQSHSNWIRQSITSRAFVIIALVSLVTVIGLTSLPITHAAGTSSLYLSPASASYTDGTSFTISVLETNSVPVNAVQVNLSYDSAKLQFVSADFGASAFNYPFPPSNSSGVLSYPVLSNLSVPANTSPNNVVSFNFKVLANVTGPTSISFAPGSQIDIPSDGSSINASLTGTNLTLSSIPSPPPPPPPPTPTPTPTPTPSSPPQTSSGAGGSNSKRTGGSTIVTPAGSTTPVTLPNNTSAQITGQAAFQPAPTAGSILGDVTKVEYYLDNKLVATETKAPFNYNIDSTNYLNGTHGFTTKTYYSSGAVKTSTQKLILKSPVSLKQTELQLVHYAAPALGGVFVLGALVLLLVNGRLRNKMMNLMHPYGFGSMGSSSATVSDLSVDDGGLSSSTQTEVKLAPISDKPMITSPQRATTLIPTNNIASYKPGTVYTPTEPKVPKK